VAERVLEIAEHGLERRSRYDESAGSDERIFLKGLRSLVSSGRSPGDLLLGSLERETVSADVILDRTALRLV
jgi:gamma-glutamylcysteine synthetase